MLDKQRIDLKKTGEERRNREEIIELFQSGRRLYIIRGFYFI